MQRTDNTVKAKSIGRQMGSSTTLNRKYVGRPKQSMDMVTTVEVKMSPKIKRFDNVDTSSTMQYASASEPMMQETGMYESEVQGLSASEFGMQEPMMQGSLMQEAEMQETMMGQGMAEEEMMVQPHPLQVSANKRVRARKNTPMVAKRATAKELKDQAIKKALASASTIESSSDTKSSKASAKPKFKVGVGRVVLALSCAALAVLAVVYFVNMNMPDISLKVAAMQTGIKASYPSFTPRDYSLSSITSGDKKIVLEFKNGHTNEAYSLVEETSSWDSNALLTNYIKPTYNDNYTMIKEQGLTVYISGSNAAWVNGGMVFKINAEDGVLSHKQIRSIATSL